MKYSVTYKGIDLEVDADVSAGQKEVRTYSNGDPGHEGHPPEFCANEIFLEGVDVTELLDAATDGKIYEQLEEAFFKQQSENQY